MNNKQWEAQQKAKAQRAKPTPAPVVTDGEATEAVNAKMVDRPRPVDREVHFQYTASMFSCG